MKLRELNWIKVKDLNEFQSNFKGAIYILERERERERFATTASQIIKKSMQNCWLQNRREYNCQYQKEERTTMVFILLSFFKEKGNWEYIFVMFGFLAACLSILCLALNVKVSLVSLSMCLITSLALPFEW